MKNRVNKGRILLLRRIAGARFFKVFILLAVPLALATVSLKSWHDLRPLPASLTLDAENVRKVQILDRRGMPLIVTYRNKWNIHNYVPLHDIPILLQQAFIHSEDKRFYAHSGVDWLARVHALFQDLKAFRKVRGASTITEQVVRMLHHRPRTVWSRWLEGLEAGRLEERFSKADILEFYLNQVPYAAKRRGVLQAAHYYFNRDLDTLDTAEILSLAVLVRAPGRMDLKSGTERIEGPLRRLAAQLSEAHILSVEDARSIASSSVHLESYGLPLEASHFVHHIYSEELGATQSRGRLFTTLDSELQYRIQRIIDARLKDLTKWDVTAGAVLVVDHRKNEALAWVNSGGGGFSGDKQASQFDGVTTPRQPGSALKPFLYAMALEKGWTAATLIDDSPISRPVGTGLHMYHNYSRRNYGKLRMRDALGNSLNIPAIRTIQFVGISDFLDRLHKLGFKSLTRNADYYGEGLALGNGEVTLLELVGAYAAIARKGVSSPILLVKGNDGARALGRRIFSKESTSIISSILSDADARHLEFGSGNLLRFPTQTAVKTGTSTDYRDAWALGFSDRYAVGVWMGNFDQHPMRNITGSTGPALVLRAVFAELNRHKEAKPLFLSPALTMKKICRVSGELANPECPAMDEWFEPEKVPVRHCGLHGSKKPHVKAASSRSNQDHVHLHLIKPSNGLQLAMDPRIPDELEALSLVLQEDIEVVKVEWLMDGVVIGSTEGRTREFLWPLRRGNHRARAKVWLKGKSVPEKTDVVTFFVK